MFSIFYDDVITPNLGYYRADMTISSTALNQSNLLNYFQRIIIVIIVHATEISPCCEQQYKENS